MGESVLRDDRQLCKVHEGIVLGKNGSSAEGAFGRKAGRMRIGEEKGRKLEHNTHEKLVQNSQQ